jgi:hypothetical protein
MSVNGCTTGGKIRLRNLSRISQAIHSSECRVEFIDPAINDADDDARAVAE